MVITLGDLIIWLIIAALVGFVGELLARRRTPFGIVGAIVVGFIAILLVVGVFGLHIAGEPTLNVVPLITSILAVDRFAEVRQTACLGRQGETNRRSRRAVLAISRANEGSQAVTGWPR